MANKKSLINPLKYFLPSKGITHGIIEKINPSRVLFYSSILALSSAALAFLGQMVTSNPTDKGLYIIGSVISFGFGILVLVLLYFLNIVHGIYWEKIQLYFVKMGKLEKNDDVSELVNNKYFVDNPKELRNFSDALHIVSRLMSFEVLLDLVLLLSVSSGVILYCLKLVTM